MRSLFLFLLLLNVLYALWQWQVGGWQVPATAGPVLEQPFRVTDSTVSDAAPLIQRDEARSGLQSATEFVTPVESTPALCVMLGTFANRAEADQLRQRLLALDVAAELVAREEVTTTDYWLVMAVSGGSKGALARLSALQERGVDSFLITRGDLAGNLSLGVFSQHDYAAARQAQLATEGYQVEIKAVEKTREQYLLQVPPRSRRLLDQAMLTRLRADFPSMQHQYQACDGVAKGSDIP